LRENLLLLADLEQQRRAVLRLDEGFRLEKDEALSRGSRDALLRLRERSRTHYQPELARVRNEVQRLAALFIPGEQWHEECLASSSAIQKRMDEAMTRFIGTPNRLLRNWETVAELACTREAPEAPPEEAGVAEQGEDELRPTDPPVVCPACGGPLMCDREFTMLVCPACGARETLEGRAGG